MQADFSLDYDVMTVERAQKLYLMARFQADEAPSNQPRRPLNMSLVIDRSGSMKGEKIDYTRQAAQFLVQHLSQHDTLSVVLYSNKIDTLLPPQQVVNKDRIAQLLERIKVHGTTNLSGGWLEGCQHVLTHLHENTLNRVVLMTDGLANRGVTDSAALVQMARQKYEEGVSTTTMGLGEGFNEDLLMEMANAGGGAFYFIESPEVAPQIFHEELSGLLRLMGQNLTISVIPVENHIAQVNQLNAYPSSTEGERTIFRMGDIYGGEVKTMMVELDVPGLRALGEQRIAILRFEYDEIAGDSTQHHVKEMPVLVNVAGDAEPRPLPNPDVAQSVLLLKAAQARQQAVKAADEGNYEEAAQKLRAIAEEIAQANIPDEQLTEEQEALRKQAERLEQGAERYDAYSRKTMSTQAFYTMTSRHDDTVMLRLREQHRAADEHQQTMHEIPIINTEQIEQAQIIRQPGVVPTHVRWNNEVFALQGDLIRVGRSSHNEIIINSKGVSRFHVQIRREDGKLLLEDLGSTNGTAIGSQELEGVHELSVGDVVYLSEEKLVFLTQDEATQLGTSDSPKT